ncbi:hypothetical protein CEXT_595331 [Caerostris extrusa]|uniref:Uncharacterized protein n=1 Tax=Caerostris extrusa TaxID=172846 RepID=A0AAV4RSG6_CAEEX|nr:hypothetical protein CEXT_595331 [Caerostris extrusa]
MPNRGCLILNSANDAEQTEFNSKLDMLAKPRAYSTKINIAELRVRFESQHAMPNICLRCPEYTCNKIWHTIPNRECLLRNSTCYAE